MNIIDLYTQEVRSKSGSDKVIEVVKKKRALRKTFKTKHNYFIDIGKMRIPQSTVIKIKKMLEEDMRIAEISKIIGVSETTVYRFKVGECIEKNIPEKKATIGLKFGNWLVLSAALSRKRNKYYLCRCECGTELEIVGHRLRSGKTIQCKVCRKIAKNR